MQWKSEVILMYSAKSQWYRSILPRELKHWGFWMYSAKSWWYWSVLARGPKHWGFEYTRLSHRCRSILAREPMHWDYVWIYSVKSSMSKYSSKGTNTIDWSKAIKCHKGLQSKSKLSGRSISVHKCSPRAHLLHRALSDLPRCVVIDPQTIFIGYKNLNA